MCTAAVQEIRPEPPAFRCENVIKHSIRISLRFGFAGHGSSADRLIDLHVWRFLRSTANGVGTHGNGAIVRNRLWNRFDAGGVQIRGRLSPGKKPCWGVTSPQVITKTNCSCRVAPAAKKELKLKSVFYTCFPKVFFLQDRAPRNCVCARTIGKCFCNDAPMTCLAHFRLPPPNPSK